MIKASRMIATRPFLLAIQRQLSCTTHGVVSDTSVGDDGQCGVGGLAHVEGESTRPLSASLYSWPDEGQCRRAWQTVQQPCQLSQIIIGNFVHVGYPFIKSKVMQWSMDLIGGLNCWNML